MVLEKAALGRSHRVMSEGVCLFLIGKIITFLVFLVSPLPLEAVFSVQVQGAHLGMLDFYPPVRF